MAEAGEECRRGSKVAAKKKNSLKVKVGQSCEEMFRKNNQRQSTSS